MLLCAETMTILSMRGLQGALLWSVELDASPDHGVERIFRVGRLLVLLFQALPKLFLSLDFSLRPQGILPESALKKRSGNDAPGPLPTRAA